MYCMSQTEKRKEQNRSRNYQNRSRSRHMKLITYKEDKEIQYQRYKNKKNNNPSFEADKEINESAADQLQDTNILLQKKTIEALKEFNEKDACTFSLKKP